MTLSTNLTTGPAGATGSPAPRMAHAGARRPGAARGGALVRPRPRRRSHPFRSAAVSPSGPLADARLRYEHVDQAGTRRVRGPR